MPRQRGICVVTACLSQQRPPAPTAGTRAGLHSARSWMCKKHDCNTFKGRPRFHASSGWRDAEFIGTVPDEGSSDQPYTAPQSLAAEQRGSQTDGGCAAGRGQAPTAARHKVRYEL